MVVYQRENEHCFCCSSKKFLFCSQRGNKLGSKQLIFWVICRKLFWQKFENFLFIMNQIAPFGNVTYLIDNSTKWLLIRRRSGKLKSIFQKECFLQLKDIFWLHFKVYLGAPVSQKCRLSFPRFFGILCCCKDFDRISLKNQWYSKTTSSSSSSHFFSWSKVCKHKKKKIEKAFL